MGSQRVGHDWATELNWWILIRKFMIHVQLPFIIILVEIKIIGMHMRPLSQLNFSSWNGELMSNSAFCQCFWGKQCLRQWHPLQYSCLENLMDRGAWWAQSMGSLRVGYDSATSLSLFTFLHWRRKWQPTPVFLPGESQGWGSLVGCRLWGPTESDTTEVT